MKISDLRYNDDITTDSGTFSMSMSSETPDEKGSHHIWGRYVDGKIAHGFHGKSEDHISHSVLLVRRANKPIYVKGLPFPINQENK